MSIIKINNYSKYLYNNGNIDDSWTSIEDMKRAVIPQEIRVFVKGGK